MIGEEITYSVSRRDFELIKSFYEEENAEWHKNVHKNGGSVIDNVNDTYDSISESSEFYIVKVANEIAAFFVKFENEIGHVCMEGFHIRKKYRNKDFLQVFWELVKKLLGDDFYTGICTKNKSALQHLRRQGLSIIRTFMYADKEYSILHFKLD